MITDAQGLSPSEPAEGKSPNLTVQSISELGVVTDNYVQEWINAHLEDCIALMSACTLDTVQPMDGIVGQKDTAFVDHSGRPVCSRTNSYSDSEMV